MINYFSFVLKAIFKNCTSAFSLLQFLKSPKYLLALPNKLEAGNGQLMAQHETGYLGKIYKVIYKTFSDI